MDARLEKILNKIKDSSLRKKVANLLENPSVKIGKQTFSGFSIEYSPAGISHHHSYPGGFIEHLIASANTALALCKIVREVYGGKVDQDYVLAGILLHDIFKPLTYAEKDDGSYGTSQLGEKLNHLTLAVSELIRMEFPLEVIHIVCAHHGYEAGLMRPKTIEALICHIADMADSRLNGEILRAARFHIANATGEKAPAQLTLKEAFEIIQAKSEKGLDEVKRIFEKIKMKYVQR